MENKLMAGLVKKVVLYSSNEVPFTSWQEKSDIISQLGKIVDLSLYQKIEDAGEITFILEEFIYEQNIKSFCKEISNILESNITLEMVEDYVEDDSIFKRLSFNRSSLGVDVDFIRICEILNNFECDIDLIKILERTFRKSIDNPLVGTLSFYIVTRT